MGHSARKGCNKCYADFESARLDIGLQRSDFAYREHVSEVLRASTRQKRDSIESKFGVRYSELLRLPYYRLIQFRAVDPMHNLFLGTAKTFLKDIWLNNQKIVLSKSDMVTRQEQINSIQVSSSMGRIPRKIASNFASLTADQWRTWTTVFSPVALRDMLPRDHFCCWLKFVDVCRLLCQRAITAVDLQQANDLIPFYKMSVNCITQKKYHTKYAPSHALASFDPYLWSCSSILAL